jgi:hypothetical protein
MTDTAWTTPHPGPAWITANSMTTNARQTRNV